MEKQKTCSWSGGKLVIIILGMTFLASIVSLAILRDKIVNSPQRSFSIIGQGKVSYQPDTAKITIGVQIDKLSKAEDALKQLNDKMNKIINSLKLVGITDEKLKTQNYSLLPQYDYLDNVSTLTGYNANEQLVVEINDIKNNPNLVGQVVEVASQSGANQILGIVYDVSNIEDLKQQARVIAISDAQHKGIVLSSTAGVRLGKVIGWWENLIQAPGINNYYYSDMGKGGLGGGSASPSLPAGSEEVIVEINVNYQIK